MHDIPTSMYVYVGVRIPFRTNTPLRDPARFSVPHKVGTVLFIFFLCVWDSHCKFISVKSPHSDAGASYLTRRNVTQLYVFSTLASKP